MSNEKRVEAKQLQHHTQQSRKRKQWRNNEIKKLGTWIPLSSLQYIAYIQCISLSLCISHVGLLCCKV